MTLRVTIVGQEPETVYEGTVYEQVVVVETTGGQTFGVFDDDMLVPPDSVSETVELEVSLLPRSKELQTITEQKKAIVPSEENPLDFLDHEFYGEIVCIEDHTSDAYVSEIDVGVGTVVVYPFKNHNPHLSIGDRVRIQASRTDVAGVGK